MSVEQELQGKFDILINFSLGLIYKDSLEADKYETVEAAKQAQVYKEAYLNNNQSLVNAYRKNTITDSPFEVYKEHNKYYRDLFIKSNVDMFISRISEDFEIISSKTIRGLDKEHEDKFKEFYTNSLTYYKHVLYTSAFHDKIDDYRAFTRFFITFMAIERFMDWFTTGENINAQLDTEYGINQLLYSHGITFLDDLPNYYKRRVLYNLGYIIRNKGSSEAFKSIFEIFNLSDVRVFKYYLSKQYRPEDKSWDIGFQKISFDEKDPHTYVNSISDDEFYRTREIYENVIKNDPSWQVTKQEIEQLQFNFVATKYIDIESVRNLQKFSTDLAYFMALIYQLEELKDNFVTMKYYLTLFNNEEVSFFNMIVTLNACMMQFCGYEDTIIKEYDQFKEMYMFNPNFDARDLSSTFFAHFDSSFFAPISNLNSTITMDTTKNLYERNILLRNNILDLMDKETDPDKYWDLQNDYKYLFMENTMITFFNNYSTYSEFLRDNSPPASTFYENFILQDKDIQRDLLNQFYTALENIINSSLVNFGNRTFLITYLRKLISFFKSYTVDLRELNFSFYIDGPLDKLKLLDKIRSTEVQMQQAQLMKMDESIQATSIITLVNKYWRILNEKYDLNTTLTIIHNLVLTDYAEFNGFINKLTNLDLTIKTEILGTFILFHELPFDDQINEFLGSFDLIHMLSLETEMEFSVNSNIASFIELKATAELLSIIHQYNKQNIIEFVEYKSILTKLVHHVFEVSKTVQSNFTVDDILQSPELLAIISYFNIQVQNLALVIDKDILSTLVNGSIIPLDTVHEFDTSNLYAGMLLLTTNPSISNSITQESKQYLNDTCEIQQL